MNSRFKITSTFIKGLTIIQRIPIADSRGYLERMYCLKTFEHFGMKNPIYQINHTLTFQRGTVRGMHFQVPPHSEIKVVSCIRGEVFDVAVDLRADSSTFLCWYGEILSASNNKAVVIPEGFAHGFQTLAENSEMIYFHSEDYAPHAADGIAPDDPMVNINWPLPFAEISLRDSAYPLLTKKFKGIRL